MLRNQVDGRRDMYVVDAPDGAAFGTAVKQGRGTWLLDACPMDGGAIALGAGITHAVWRREATLFATVTRAGSSATGAEVALGEVRDPVVASDGGRVDMAWTGAGGIVLRQGERAPEALGPGGFASIVALPAHTLVASEHQGRVTIVRRGR